MYELPQTQTQTRPLITPLSTTNDNTTDDDNSNNNNDDDQVTVSVPD